jgi:hypothetical protein
MFAFNLIGLCRVFEDEENVEKLKLYLVGLIAADGHIEQNGYVTIAQKDKRFTYVIADLLARINMKVSSLFYDKSAGVWKIKIRDPVFYRYLFDMGLIAGRKCDRIVPPKIKPEKALPYIIGI